MSSRSFLAAERSHIVLKGTLINAVRFLGKLTSFFFFVSRVHSLDFKLTKADKIDIVAHNLSISNCVVIFNISY